MLEEEGVVFQSEGGADRIRRDCFVDGFPGANLTTNIADRSSSHGTKKQKKAQSDNIVENQPSMKPEIASMQNNTTESPTEEMLKAEIIALLQDRSPGKTC
ncbi:hypothetical protein HJC23_012336 [Cyclotella cryptica]|uniref:Uncharacterized protein n=1 Tax=Cyclotella cryptica TaxID=29204 RepID=A0ABD3QJ97_9STRA